MNILEELSYEGRSPAGPCSAWPRERHDRLMASSPKPVVHKKTVEAGLMRMASGLVKSGAQAITHGRVSQEIRDERYETCKSCPFFVEDSKRCSECGCFMEAKTWIGGDPNQLCPKQKWSR